MSFLLDHTVPHEFILRFSKSSKSLGGEKKLSINILCPKPSTLQVKCGCMCCSRFVSGRLRVGTQVHSHVAGTPSFITRFVNFDAETFYFLGNIVPEDNAALEFYSYVVGSKSFRPDQLFKVTEIKQLRYFST